MKYLITLFVIIYTAEAGKHCEHTKPRLDLVMPENVIAGEDLHGTCISEHDERPRVTMVRNGKCSSEVEYINANGQNDNCGQADFLIKNISATCTYRCFLCGSWETKTVSVIDAKIISSSSNITIIENMPLRLNCTVMANDHSKYHKLLWLEGDAFIPSGDIDYSMWSSQFDCNTESQDHYLTIRRVVQPTAYTCALVSTSGKIMDSKTHYVSVTEADSVVTSLLQYLAKFFK